MKRIFLVLLFALIVETTKAEVVPALPQIISGEVIINGKPAPINTRITAKANNIVIENYLTSKAGYYAITLNAKSGEQIEIFVNGIEADETFFENGKVEELNLKIRQGNITIVLGGLVVLILLSLAGFLFIRKKYKRI